MAGAAVGGFGAGFAKGLANVLLANRQEQTRKREREEEVKYRNFQVTAPLMAQNFFANPTPEGAAALEDFYGQFNPEMLKLIKRSGFSFETLGPLLSQQQPGQPAYTEAIPEVPGATRQSSLPARGGALVPVPDQQTRLFGAPVLTPEQKAARERDIALTDLVAQIGVRRDIAARLGKSPQEALDFGLYGNRPPVGAREPFQSVAGELPDGTPAFGVFDQELGVYRHPETKQPLLGFKPRTTTGNSDLDQALETYAKSKNKNVSQLTWEEMLEARKAISQATERPVVIQTVTGPQVVDRSAGTASPITSETGAVVGPAPTAEMRNRQEARRLVIPAIDEIEKLGGRVITRVGPAQRADATRRGAAAVLGSDPEWRTYRDARLALAGNLAVLQQGSRPSDTDIERVWLPLVPDVFADTTESAAMKWRLIRIISSIDPTTKQPVGAGAGGGTSAPQQQQGAPPPSGQQGVPGTVMTPDGRLFINGVEIPQ